MPKVIKNLTMDKPINESIFKFLLVALFLTSVLYIYFICSTVGAVVGNRQNIKIFEEINQNYHQLENQYFNLVGKLDLDYAHKLGFVDHETKVEYTQRQSPFAKR